MIRTGIVIIFKVIYNKYIIFTVFHKLGFVFHWDNPTRRETQSKYI